jgi:hypothetical protein
MLCLFELKTCEAEVVENLFSLTCCSGATTILRGQRQKKTKTRFIFTLYLLSLHTGTIHVFHEVNDKAII